MTLRSCWNLNQFRLRASWTIGVVGGSPVLDKVQTKNFSFFLPFRELKLAKTDIFCNLVGWRRFDCLQFCHVWVSVLTEVFFVPDVWLLGLSPSGLPPVQTSLGPGSGWPRRGHKLQLHPPLLHHQSQTPQLSTAVWQSFLEHSSDSPRSTFPIMLAWPSSQGRMVYTDPPAQRQVLSLTVSCHWQQKTARGAILDLFDYLPFSQMRSLLASHQPGYNKIWPKYHLFHVAKDVKSCLEN